MSVISTVDADLEAIEATQVDFVQSFARGLEVIKAFDADHVNLTLTEVARRAKISPAAARRFLRTLEVLEYVRSDGKTYSLTSRILDLGFSYLSALSLPEVMQPHLDALSRSLGESVSASILAGNEVVYIARAPANRIMSINITVGTRFPAYPTSMGRALLAALPADLLEKVLNNTEFKALTARTIISRESLQAELDIVRAQGWALVDGELDDAVRSVAAPIKNYSGEVVAAINISTVASTDSLIRLTETLLPQLLATARRIESDLMMRR